MDPSNIPINALIVGPRKSGKSRFVVDQLFGPFRGKFDFIVLICPTFLHNKTFFRFAEKDDKVQVIVCQQDEVEKWVKVVAWIYESTNTLLILDDCAASKDVKKHSGPVSVLSYSGRHTGISLWIVAQKFTSITTDFRQNIDYLVLFRIPSATSNKMIFETFGGDTTEDERKEFLSKLKERDFSFLVFNITARPFGVRLFEQKEQTTNG